MVSKSHWVNVGEGIKRIFVVFLAISLPANAAEFSLNGSVIKSSIVVNETRCAGYRILVKDDRFSDEVYGKVPERYGIPGYAGASSDLIVSVHVFVKIGSTEKEVPSVIESYQAKGRGGFKLQVQKVQRDAA